MISYVALREKYDCFLTTPLFFHLDMSKLHLPKLHKTTKQHYTYYTLKTVASLKLYGHFIQCLLEIIKPLIALGLLIASLLSSY